MTIVQRKVEILKFGGPWENKITKIVINHQCISKKYEFLNFLHSYPKRKGEHEIIL